MKHQYYQPDFAGINRERENRNCLQYVLGNMNYWKGYVYNYYTGKGGLSGEEFSQHANFAAYTAAKKEYEQGQFFTPALLCKNIVEILEIGKKDKVIDPTCGRGDFFNFCPLESNCYGIEFEENAARVAAYLYETANIKKADFLNFAFDEKFDIALCNPPFNLRWTYEGQERSSQEVFMLRLAESLKPAAVVALIVPSSWLNDPDYYKNTINKIAEKYCYIGGYELPANTFSYLGVDKFATKVLFFQHLGAGVTGAPYSGTTTKEIAVKAVKAANNYRVAKTGTIAREMWSSESLIKTNGFAYKVTKLLYEMKTHAHLLPYYTRALRWVQQFAEEQKAGRPDGMSQKEWEKVQLSERAVLAKMKRYFKAAESAKKAEGKEFELTGEEPAAKGKNKRSEKSERRKQRGYNLTRTPYNNIPICPILGQWIEDFTFVGGLGTKCHFNALQAQDLNRILQKRYNFIAWEQGSGKTGVAHAWGTWLLQQKKVKKVFVLSTAMSIKSTWKDHLSRNKVGFRMIETREDCKGDDVQFFLVTFEGLQRHKDKKYTFREKNPVKGHENYGKYETVQKSHRHYKKIYAAIREEVKAGRAAVIVDESDEMTNNTAGKTRHAFAAFQHAAYKLLCTGTATRNNISELYPQANFLYNNSPAMLNTCEYMYDENKKGELVSYKNIEPNAGEEGDFAKLNQPYKFRTGQNDFRRCFNPSKATVLGISKQNQDVFNSEELAKICAFMMITRTFNEVAGTGKYSFESHVIDMTWQEGALYQRIFDELKQIEEERGRLTGRERADASRRLLNQMNFLIESCSTPQKFKGYDLPHGSKAAAIVEFCKTKETPILLGCITHKAAQMYAALLEKAGKVVFVGTGEETMNQRKNLAKEMQATPNSVLVCTQQAFKSSINIPGCNTVICESLQWNLPKLAQFYFRCIRFDSKKPTTVHFFLMKDSIEENLMALLMDKQRLNEFVKTGELKSSAEVFEDMELEIFERAIQKTKDKDDKTKLGWGKAKNDGVELVGGVSFEKYNPYWMVKNKAGQEVVGIAQFSDIATKKVYLGFANTLGQIVKTVGFEAANLKQSSVLAFKKYLDGLKERLAKEKGVGTAQYYSVPNKTGKLVIGKFLEQVADGVLLEFFSPEGKAVKQATFVLETLEPKTAQDFQDYLQTLKQKVSSI